MWRRQQPFSPAWDRTLMRWVSNMKFIIPFPLDLLGNVLKNLRFEVLTCALLIVFAPEDATLCPWPIMMQK
jgi:hypothetical protein